MHAKQKTETIPCTPGAFPGGLTRTRFYDGMLLTQTHMEREQNFWRMKRKLTNRALGTGVVWGLRLEWDASKRKFLLSPGYALDCCGNDLVVECPQEITERTLIDKHDPQVQAFLAGHADNLLKCPEPGQDLPRKACLILQYVECAGDPQPVFEDNCTSNVTHCEYSSVRESTRVCLVPPPADPEPTPIDSFCKRLEMLRQECEELADCTLFNKDESLSTSRIPVYIEVRNLDNGSPATSPPVQVQPEASESAFVTIEVPLPATDDRLQIVIKPAPGYVILGGELNTDSSVSFAPFGGAFDTTGTSFLTTGDAPFTIADIRVGSLLTNETLVGADLELSMARDGDGNNNFRVVTASFEQLPVEETCNDKLAPSLVFNQPPECTFKTLALVALCGWFKGLLADDTKAPLNGKHVAAWWVCYLAWKILFGANLDDEKSSVLNDALKDLLEEWCAAFVYPGPYCRDAHHGVYLGCVEVSRKGSILSFDPWAHRRYVLTGPLLTHWGSLFGLAPIDVVAGRFAGWICCLGNASMPAISGATVASMIDGLPLDRFGRTIVAGDGAAVSAHMAKHNLNMVGSVQAIDLNEFASRMLHTPDYSEGGHEVMLTSGRRVYEVRRIGLFLLEPARDRVFPLKPEAEGATVSHLVEMRTQSLRPLARGLVSDYAVEVARAIELAKLKVLTGNAAMTALVNEVNRYEITTAENYLNTGPERAVRLALANFDELDDVETERDLFVAAEELTLANEAVLDAVIEPFVEDKVDTGGGPLLGDSLIDIETAKVVGRSLRPHLKSNTLTNANLKKIGERVAERSDLVLDRSRE